MLSAIRFDARLGTMVGLGHTTCSTPVSVHAPVVLHCVREALVERLVELLRRGYEDPRTVSSKE